MGLLEESIHRARKKSKLNDNRIDRKEKKEIRKKIRKDIDRIMML